MANTRQVNCAAMTTTVARGVTIVITIISKAYEDTTAMGITTDTGKEVATISHMTGVAESMAGMAVGRQ